MSLATQYQPAENGIAARALAAASSGGGLARYEAACRAVAEAKSVDEVKEFRNEAEAMRAYAKQAKNKQLETDAAEIRIRAERRIGELMAGQREAGLLPEGRPKNGLEENPFSKPITLSEAAGTHSNPRKTLATWGRHADTGAGEASPLCPPAPVPFSPRWPVPWIESTGCQFPVDVRGHVEPGQHMNMLVCDEPNIPGKRWCEHHFNAFFYKSDKRLRAVA